MPPKSKKGILRVKSSKTATYARPKSKPQATIGRKKRGQRRRNKKQQHHSYQAYIYKLIKSLRPQHGITQKGMEIMNTFVDDMFNRIAKDASDLLLRSGRKILLTSDIKAAVLLNLDGDLAAHAITEGNKALLELERNS